VVGSINSQQLAAGLRPEFKAHYLQPGKLHPATFAAAMETHWKWANRTPAGDSHGIAR